MAKATIGQIIKTTEWNDLKRTANDAINKQVINKGPGKNPHRLGQRSYYSSILNQMKNQIGELIQADELNRVQDISQYVKDNCGCNCDYSCTCNCHERCSCNTFCLCDCDYCTCHCDYVACPCDCNRCTCDCNESGATPPPPRPPKPSTTR